MAGPSVTGGLPTNHPVKAAYLVARRPICVLAASPFSSFTCLLFLRIIPAGPQHRNGTCRCLTSESCSLPFPILSRATVTHTGDAILLQVSPALTICVQARSSCSGDALIRVPEMLAARGGVRVVKGRERSGLGACLVGEPAQTGLQGTLSANEGGRRVRSRG